MNPNQIICYENLSELEEHRQVKYYILRRLKRLQYDTNTLKYNDKYKEWSIDKTNGKNKITVLLGKSLRAVWRKVSKW